MRVTRIALAGALIAVVAGCASTGGLEPQGVPLDAANLKAERSLPATGSATAQWPGQDWWAALGDPRLDALVNEALRDNPDMAAAAARTRKAQAQAAVVDAGRKPSINAAASVSGAHLPSTLLEPPMGGSFGWVKYGYLKFDWDLDLWGGKRAAWEAALGQARAAAVDAQAARLLVSTSVARAYAQLGYAFAVLDVVDADLERAHTVLQLTTQRVHAGIDSQLALHQAKGDVASAEQQQAAAGRQVDAARVALAVLLGKGPDRGLDIVRPQLLTPAALGLPSTLPAQLLGHRPDVVAARWRVPAAARGIDVAKSRFLPNISLGAMAGLVAGGSDNLFQLPARFYQVAPALSLPIFDGGALRAGLRGSDAAYDLAVAQYNKTLVGAINQIADRRSGLQSLAVQAAAQQRALDAARQAWELADQRYRGGIGNYLDALAVRRQLLEAEQGMAALHAHQVDLSVQLIQALGGGFAPIPADPMATATTPDAS